MASTHGRIARQLTQWVGGTIVVLMFVFVLADYGIQARYFRRYQDDIAKRGAEGLRIFVESRTLEEARDALQTTLSLAGYVENQGVSVVLYDMAGNVILNSAGTVGAGASDADALSRPVSGDVEIRRVTISGSPAVAAVTSFRSKDPTPVSGQAAYVINVAEQQQIGLELWSWRSGIVLMMILGVMLAVRIPVKRFVVQPIDGLFLGAYAASRDDYRTLPPCPVDNEFRELYDMFNRMMGHLEDTRASDVKPAASSEEAEEGLHEERTQ